MSKSKAISVRLKDRQTEQLDRLARREGRDKAEMAATLLERVLRLSEFPHVVLRDFGAGPEAFISGTRLRVWWVATLIRDYGGSLAKTAEHLNLPEVTIAEVQKYADAYPDEIEAAIAENDRAHEKLLRRFPDPKVIAVDLTAADAPAP